MKRRTLLAAAAAAPLARPALAQGDAARTLRLMPQADLSILDPLNTTAYITRNHGHMVWDTLYGVDESMRPHPQMAAGHTTEDEGRRWTFTLREGLLFHDGTPVRAADAVASIRRWMLRDAHGQTLATRLDEMRALDDRRFEMRLKRPFALMLDALGKPSSYPCFIYPERLATQDPNRAFTEAMGSGPYRFIANERVAGSVTVYQKFDRYVPAPGTTSMLAGPKVANFERMEWRWLPDPSTAANALIQGEIDWYENVAPDQRQVVARNRNIVTEVLDTNGTLACLRLNHMHPPFNDVRVRQAVLQAISQSDAMQLIMGEDRSLWQSGVGVFPPGTPMASDAGVPPGGDIAGARAAIQAAGAMGAKALMIQPGEFPINSGLSILGVDVMKRIGLDAESAVSDWGTMLQRRASRAPVAQGGWNALVALFGGIDFGSPAGHLMLRGNGPGAWFGWPDLPELERLRDAWFDASDAAAQVAAARAMQEEALRSVAYVPLGQYFQSTAYRRTITGVLRGMTLPLNVRRV